jgi:ATP-dependent RNA helicase SUPV3L1/SUV3
MLAPLAILRDAEDLTSVAHDIAVHLIENFGSLRREAVAEAVRLLNQASRGQLRKYGVRFGSYSIFIPALLKPAPARTLLMIWALARKDVIHPFDGLPTLPVAGLTSVPVDLAVPAEFYHVLGFRICGYRAVRLDMLERIADLIRLIIATRRYNGGFIITPAMMSLVGCSSEEFSGLLKSLGYRSHLERVNSSKIENESVEPSNSIVGMPCPDMDSLSIETPKSVETVVAARVIPVKTEIESINLEIWRPHRPHHKSRQRSRYHRKTEIIADSISAVADNEVNDKQTEELCHQYSRTHYRHKYDENKTDNVSQSVNRSAKNKFSQRSTKSDGRSDNSLFASHNGNRYSYDPFYKNKIDLDSPFAILAVLKERV